LCNNPGKVKTMQNKNTIIKIFSSFLVWIIVILDGLSIFAFGLFGLVIAGIADPGPDGAYSKDALFFWTGSIALLSFIYLVVCFISLIFWQKGKRNWGYVILGLGLIHLAGSSYLFNFRDAFDFIVTLFYGSLIMNLLLLAIIINGIIRSKPNSRGQNSQA
jgi:hypothetical protein